MVAGLWYPSVSLLSYASSTAVGTAIISFTVPAQPVGTYGVVGYGITSKATAYALMQVSASAAGSHQPVRSSVVTLPFVLGGAGWCAHGSHGNSHGGIQPHGCCPLPCAPIGSTVPSFTTNRRRS